MNYYLIDYENTSEAGLGGIEKLDSNSTVAIFYSPTVCKLSFEMHKILCNVKAVLEYHEVGTNSKNALDFQLSTYLGYLISQNSQDSFYIISKDNGYSAVIKFWAGKNIKIEQLVSISECDDEKPEAPVEPEAEEVKEDAPAQEPAPKIKKIVVKKTKTKKRDKEEKGEQGENRQAEIYKEVLKVIPEPELANKISGFICHYKTKLGLNNAIVKEYGSEKRGEIYKKIKPLLKDKKGN